MASLKLQKTNNKLQEKTLKVQIEEVKSPVVNQEKSGGLKGLWSVLSSFVLVAGDLV